MFSKAYNIKVSLSFSGLYFRPSREVVYIFDAKHSLNERAFENKLGKGENAGFQLSKTKKK